MRSLLRPFELVMAAFNRAALWREECRVWDHRMKSDTFDRWLYLRLHRFGRMGREERAILPLIARTGMTIVDVGSNLGLYTVVLSRLVGDTGRVIAFEPDPDLFSLLNRNCILNDCGNVESYNLALGCHQDRLILRKLIMNSGDNTLGKGGSRHFRREIEIGVVAMDEFLPQLRPDLVKIDVQGWEFEVLKGMVRLMQLCPEVAFHIELWPDGLRRAGASPKIMREFLIERGFTLWLADQLEGDPLTASTYSALCDRLTGLTHADIYARRLKVPTTVQKTK